MQKTQRPFNKNRIFWYLVIASSSSTPSSGLCSASSALFSAVPCLIKNAENARTIRPKSSQASGWHAKRPDMQFHLCFTGQTGPWAENTTVFAPNFGGSQGAPGRAPRGLQEASLQPCPQEAPKRCHMSPRGPLAHKRVTSVSQACRALSTLGQPRRDTRSVNNYPKGGPNKNSRL